MRALHFGVVIVPHRAKRRMTTEVPKNRDDFVDLDSTDIETNCWQYPATSSPPWEVSQRVSYFIIFPCVWTFQVTISCTCTTTSGECPHQTDRFLSLTHAIDHKTSTWSLVRTLPPHQRPTMANLRYPKE